MQEWLTQMAGTITSITVIGAFLIKVYQKIIVEQRDKKRAEKEQIRDDERREFEVKLLDRFECNQKPLQEAIDRLNELLDESQRDRDALHKIADVNTLKLGEHDTKIHELDDRLIVVETYQGLKKATYK